MCNKIFILSTKLLGKYCLYSLITNSLYTDNNPSSTIIYILKTHDHTFSHKKNLILKRKKKENVY